ncbi:ABC transporter permease (plasmid) [Agrobacterium salinitolerans]|uniref:ABC transporter permease n=1 Tax=Agrobacterium salinitolerans TaxID=1183413 RepID=UPI001C23E422|nr:ABC transporter permease [Agrobacterium salinitolerans]QXC52518.1 ABC transporter permease [Agrobacterium salinitolerans]
MSDPDRKLLPLGLTLPALVFYGLLLAVPLGATFVLSLQVTGGYGAGNYLEILTDSYFHTVFLRTFILSVSVTAVCVVFGTPQAIILSRMANPWRGLFLVAILGPFLISVIVRTLGWAILLGSNGPISLALQFLGLSDSPVSLLYSMPGMIIALVHVLIPFVVISVWVSLQRCDPDVERAGASLGANEFVILRRLVLPQIVPGIVSGSIVVFSLAATAFATPAIIGGRRLKVAATAVYDEFLSTLNWPLGAAIAVTLLVANLLILAAYNRMTEARRRDAAGLAVLTQKEQL